MPDTKSRPVDRRFQNLEQRSQRPFQWRWLLVVVAPLLALLAIPAYQYYQTYVHPPRVPAASIDGETIFTMGDVVKLLLSQQSAQRALGQNVNLTTAPFQTVRTMAEDELIRRAAPSYGITVTTADIDEGLRQRFYPVPKEGEDPPQSQLDREFREEYTTFLSSARLSDADYREVVRRQIYRDRMRAELSSRVPTAAPHAEVMWVRLPASHVNPRAVADRLRNGEADFATVVREENNDSLYVNTTDRPGYVGWVPEGAFPFLDPVIFGPSDGRTSAQEAPGSLQQEEVSAPVYAGEYVYIVKLLAPPETRDIEEGRMRDKMRSEALRNWLDQEWARQGVGLNMNSRLYDWIVRQVQQGLPPAQAGRS